MTDRAELAEEIERAASYGAVKFFRAAVPHLRTILAALREPSSTTPWHEISDEQLDAMNEAVGASELTAEMRAMGARCRALREPSNAAVEAAAIALYESMRAPHERDWRNESTRIKDCHRASAREVLHAARERLPPRASPLT